jgi:mRNA-degrading endonuclease RelE of RelBE toxin-antitoxin system
MAGAFRLRLGDYRVLFALQKDTMRMAFAIAPSLTAEPRGSAGD